MEAAEVDKELDELQGKVEQLRALYEQYFMGFDRVEPLVQRKDLERRVKSLRREQLRNTAQRFKLNTLVQRINTMQQHWARVVREIENGTYRRDVLRAAARFGEGALVVLGQKKRTRDLVAAVAKAQLPRPTEGTFELAADDLVEDDDDAPTPPKLERLAIPRREPRPVTSDGLGQSDLPVVRGSTPSDQRAAAFGELDSEAPASAARPPANRLPLRFGELDLPLDDEPRPARPVRLPTPGPVRPGGELSEQRIRQIYAQYLETKRSTQESIAGVTFEKLAASLRSQTDRLKSAHPNRSVDYEVVVKDGKTHLKPVLR